MHPSASGSAHAPQSSVPPQPSAALPQVAPAAVHVRGWQAGGGAGGVGTFGTPPTRPSPQPSATRTAAHHAVLRIRLPIPATSPTRGGVHAWQSRTASLICGLSASGHCGAQRSRSLPALASALTRQSLSVAARERGTANRLPTSPRARPRVDGEARAADDEVRVVEGVEPAGGVLPVETRLQVDGHRGACRVPEVVFSLAIEAVGAQVRARGVDALSAGHL